MDCRPEMILFASSPVKTPALASAAVQAMDPATSCFARRRSKGREVLNAQAFGSNWLLKRLPHRVIFDSFFRDHFPVLSFLPGWSAVQGKNP